MRNNLLSKLVVAWVSGLLTLGGAGGAEPLFTVKPSFDTEEIRQSIGVVFGDDGKHRGVSSAFCSHHTGIYVTGAAGLTTAKVGDPVEVVLDPGGAKQRKVKTTLARRTEHIAVLEAERKEGHFPLPLARDGEERLDLPWYPLGYETVPTADKLATKRLKLLSAKMKPPEPTQRVYGGPVTLPVSMAGAPMVNDDGRVVGVYGSGREYPRFRFNRDVYGLISGVRATFLNPVVTEEMTRSEFLTFGIRVEFLDGEPEFVVDKVVGQVGGKLKPELARVGGGDYSVKIERRNGVYFGTHVEVTAEYDNGKIVKGLAHSDFDLRAGENSFFLSQLRKITRSNAREKKATLVGKNGKSLPVENLTGLGYLRDKDGRNWDLSSASVVEIGAFHLASRQKPLYVRLQLWAGDRLVASIQDEVPFQVEDAFYPETYFTDSRGQKPKPPSDGPAHWEEVPMPEATRLEKVPGVITDMMPAGGGRYVVAYLGELGKCAVFDLLEDKRLGYINVGENALVAAGLNSVISFRPDDKKILRHSLPDLKLVAQSEWKLPMVPYALVMGSGAKGRAIAGVPPEGMELGRSVVPRDSKLTLVEISEEDLGTRMITVRTRKEGKIRYQIKGATMRASRDGKAFTQLTSHSAISLIAKGHDIEAHWRFPSLLRLGRDSIESMVPSADSSMLLCSGTVFDMRIDKVPNMGCFWSKRAVFLPSEDPRYYLSNSRSLLNPNHKSPVPFGFVHDAKTHRPIAVIPRPPISADGYGKTKAENDAAWRVPIDRRWIFVPQVNKLVILQDDGLGILVVPFDLEKERRDDLPYLNARSEGFLQLVTKGQAIDFKVETDSDAEVAFTPAAGFLNVDGQVRFTVPRKTKHDHWTERIHYRITDANGNELSFTETFTTDRDMAERSGL